MTRVRAQSMLNLIYVFIILIGSIRVSDLTQKNKNSIPSFSSQKITLKVYSSQLTFYRRCIGIVTFTNFILELIALCGATFSLVKRRNFT